MPSHFVEHYTLPLTQHPLSSTSSNNNVNLSSTETSKKQSLRSSLASLSNGSSLSDIQRILTTLDSKSSRRYNSALEPRSITDVTRIDEEEDALERAIMSKLIISLYSESLDTFLRQSVEVEEMAEWWARRERSKLNVAWYLLQTLPIRLSNTLKTIVEALHTRGIPVQLSSFKPSTLKELFPSAGMLRPSALLTSMFPHLKKQNHLLSLGSPAFVLFNYQDKSPPKRIEGFVQGVVRFVSDYVQYAWTLVRIPLDLTRDECTVKRVQLEEIRDRRARILGSLAQQRGFLSDALEKESTDMKRRMFYYHLRPFAVNMQDMIEGRPPKDEVPSSPFPVEIPPLLSTIQHLSSTSLPAITELHEAELKDLRKPSRLTLVWPKLVLIPPLSIFAVQYLYTSRADIEELGREAVETIRGFVVGWLIEPVKDIINTVRAKPDGGVIVQKEGVIADMDSLERMVLSLARDQLKYDTAELDELSRQVRVGDLTPVLKLYEENIRTPVKSAITGNLLRSLFIQIQKAKVDIDQALTGIDKLLKSQELTFAFVGLSPALLIAYLVGGYVKGIWTGASGRGRFGGKEKRASTMFTIRRIERLLNADSGKKDVTPLTAGLLLLSVAHLRSYGEKYLPSGSRLREGFLEDVEDLEDPSFGRAEKKAVVERMWRNWGDALGWRAVAGTSTFV